MKSFKQHIDEATNINKKDLPVYAPVEGKKGFYKVVGHVRRNAKSTGAAKVGGSRTAIKTMKLKSPEYPEGPGWIIQEESIINEAVMVNFRQQTSHDQRWSRVHAKELVDKLKKAKVKHKTDNAYYVSFDVQSYNNSALAKKIPFSKFIKDIQDKNGKVDYSERDPMGRKKRFESYNAINEDIKINFLGGIDPKLQAILDKYPKEYARVMAGAELSDRRNVQFFDAAYEYFYDQDPVAARRQAEDTEEFVWERLVDIGDSHSQRWGIVYARDLVKELKKAKVKHKTDKRYKVEINIKSYNDSALADNQSVGELIANAQEKNATVDFTER